MKLRINEDYDDNQTIAEILWDIENSGDELKIDKAYSYIDKWCDNLEEVCPDGYYDFTNASWGISEENIIEYLTNILNESVNITRHNINEKETPNIEVKNKGILEVPEGKNVDDLPLSHFVNLANKKGSSKITKALNNLQVWNKNDDTKLSKWAGNMIDKLNKKLKKDESLTKIKIKEDFIDDLVPDKVYPLSVLNDWWYDVIKQAKKIGIKDSEIDSKDENTLLFTFPAWDGLGYDRYERLYNWCVTHIYNLPEYIEAYKELQESLTKENSKYEKDYDL